MRKRKIIHIYRRAYGYWFPEPGSDAYFLAGHSGVIAKYTVKYFGEIYCVENWRPDKNVKHTLKREVEGVVCKVFPSLYIKGFGDISIPLLKELRKEKKHSEIIIHHSGVHTPSLYEIALLFKDVPIVAQHHGDNPPNHSLETNRGFKIFSGACHREESIKIRRLLLGFKL